MGIEVQGRGGGREGRAKRMWLESTRADLGEKALSRGGGKCTTEQPVGECHRP